MELVIHGTKGGYKILYSTPNLPLSVARDVRPDTSSENAIGQSAYSLSFIDKGRVYTKYRIVRDMLRGMYTGNIAISIYLTHLEVLPGSEIVSLLNNLLDYYRINYANGDNLDDLREDWSFVDKILKDYKSKTDFNKEYENIKSGLNDACYIYYENEYQLQKYFDNPYQDEYNEFKQVIFINNNLKNVNENPLFAIRNSGIDLTDKIDLENPKYKLIFNANARGNLKISVKVNGNYRNGSCNIKRKDILEISWSKPYHINKNISGKCFEISEYLIINDDNKTVNIKEIELETETKSILLQIVDANGMPVNDAEVNCKGNNFMPEKPVYGNTILFNGEEIKESWTISAKKGANFKSESIIITPVNQYVPLEIKLREFIIVNFIPVYNKENFKYDFNLNIKGKSVSPRSNQIEFYDEEIDKTWNVEVLARNGNSNYYGRESFCPLDNKTVYVTIEKNKDISKENKYYSIDAGEYGKKSKHCPPYSIDSDGKDLGNDAIKAKNGYVFIGWKLDEKNKPYHQDGVLVAQYKKTGFFSNPKPIIIAAAILIVVFLGFWILPSFWKSDKIPQDKLSSEEIMKYIEGEEFLTNKLNEYKNSWENQKPENNKENGSFWSVFGFGNNEQKEETTNIEEWEKTKQNIETAIKLRDYVDNLNFKELKNQIDNIKQSKFKKSIENIDSTLYDSIENQLHNYRIADMELNVIADSIDAFVARINAKAEKDEVNNEEKSENKSESNKSEKKSNPKQTNKPIVSDNKGSSIKNTDNEDLIRRYLTGNELKISELEKYSKIKGISKELKKSINLCLKFWKLNGENKMTYYSFKNEITKDKYLQNSLLNNFLNEVSKKNEPFYPSKLAGGGITKFLNDLKTKNNIK